jgi:hypothetical protein
VTRWNSTRDRDWRFEGFRAYEVKVVGKKEHLKRIVELFFTFRGPKKGTTTVEEAMT